MVHQSDNPPASRNPLREALAHLLEPQRCYSVHVATVLGHGTPDILAAIYLQHLMYWGKYGRREDGFIYKTAREVEQETGITRRQQDRIRRTLTGLGLLEEMRCTMRTGERDGGHSVVMHFRVDMAAVTALVEQYYSTEHAVDPDETGIEIGMHQTDMSKSCIPDSEPGMHQADMSNRVECTPEPSPTGVECTPEPSPLLTETENTKQKLRSTQRDIPTDTETKAGTAGDLFSQETDPGETFSLLSPPDGKPPRPLPAATRRAAQTQKLALPVPEVLLEPKAVREMRVLPRLLRPADYRYRQVVGLWQWMAKAWQLEIIPLDPEEIQFDATLELKLSMLEQQLELFRDHLILTSSTYTAGLTEWLTDDQALRRTLLPLKPIGRLHALTEHFVRIVATLFEAPTPAEQAALRAQGVP